MAKIESLLITVVVSSFPHEWIRRVLEVGCIRKDESCASGDPGEDDVADVESVVQAKIVEAEDGVMVPVLVSIRKFGAVRRFSPDEVASQRIEASKSLVAPRAEAFFGYVSGDVFDDVLSQFSLIATARNRAGMYASRSIRLFDTQKRAKYKGDDIETYLIYLISQFFHLCRRMVRRNSFKT